MRAILWTSNNGDLPAIMAFTNNLSATTNPAITDDASEKYEPGSIWINVSSKVSFQCVDATEGAANWIQLGNQTDDNAQFSAPAATTPTGTGGDALLRGGVGGTTSGAGGKAQLVGGAATAGNSNGGDALIQGGAKQGTGVDGVIPNRSFALNQQGAPAAKTVSGLLTAANLMAGIITVNQGAAGASAQQLPIAADLDTAIPQAIAGDSFDFSVINISTVDAEDASVTTNTGWTLVGSMDVQAHSALAAQGSSGRFRARKTGTAAWTLYRTA